MPVRKVILIGGASTVGKTTVARALAKHFAIPWISTDQIRRIMRVATSRKESPKLFELEGYDAERFLNNFSSEQIVKMGFDQAEAVWPGVLRFIRFDHLWTEGFVVEGISILPHLIASDFAGDADLKAVFLVDEDLSRMRRVIFARGLWHRATDYPDSVKEKEVSWASLFGRRVREDASKYGYPVIEVQKGDEDLARVLAALGVS